MPNVIQSEITQAKITVILDREIETIYAANHTYWLHEGIHSLAANAEYDLRQLRLKEILRELNAMWPRVAVRAASR
jgi:hypothetical protein